MDARENVRKDFPNLPLVLMNLAFFLHTVDYGTFFALGTPQFLTSTPQKYGSIVVLERETINALDAGYG